MIVRAYAKINLTLDIVGKREDGYHLIDSVFQSVGVFDVVRVNKSNTLSVRCTGIQNEDNIAFRAAKEFFRFTGIKGGAEIEIEKNIPVCSGLGGGSADSAAVIVALNKIYGTSLSKEKLAGIGLKCGADVPFFIYGGTARIGGIGEIVKPLDFAEGFHALLLKEGKKQSTADMYARLDGVPAQKPSTGEFLEAAAKSGYKEALKYISNAFLPVSEGKSAYEALKSQNPIAVSLSGSGPTYFAIFENEDAAKKAGESLNGQGVFSLIAPFVSCGIKIIE